MSESDLHFYARSGRISELRRALQDGAAIDERDQFGLTPLHYAVAQKQDAMVEELLADGANLAAQDRDGKTPLYYAAELRLARLAKRLIEASPASLSVADNYGNQPLWAAAFAATLVIAGRDYDLVSFMLEHGADPNHRNSGNLCPMDIAKRASTPELLKILESGIRG
jgi:ankyrin repeat protein